MSRALVVDDDLDFQTGLAELVQKEGFKTTTAKNLAEARQQLKEDPAPDVVLVDLMLPDGRGLDLKNDLPPGARTEIIVITGHASVDSVIDALRNDVHDYLTKPLDIPRLKAVLANLVRTTELKQEIGTLRDQLRELGRFGRLIGASPAMQKVYDLIAKVAPTDATVLLTGESGTGKEVVAQTIHELSRRRRGSFLPLNCGAMPEGLIESELFGHERGSFTGATQLRRGYFERASAGTLFLDEISEMPIELQVKLLRVLETSVAVRVGGDAPIAVDARVIAATNRSPEQAVEDGKLREDLLYRLNVFPIALPPLSARQGDVPLLAEHFLAELNESEGTQKRYASGAIERLEGHAWPGNVREMRNVIQRAFIMAESEVDPQLPDGAPIVRSAARSPAGVQPGVPLAEVERQAIMATLERNGGDKRKTAAMLGIALKTLYNRLKQYQLEAAPVATNGNTEVEEVEEDAPGARNAEAN
ncbi:MAG TPA: sigma-54 dependent transcriptional regulator [Candidatus Eisenbacteria bacterium]|nr:sigma-54 dependent transcriptional regulator [Candidatus Eisenbacteria bacterium]